MVVYAALLLLVVILGLISQERVVLTDGRLMKVNDTAYNTIIFTSLVAVAGLRGLSVGIDTLTYYIHFEHVKNAAGLSQALHGVLREQGYSIFEFIIAHVFGEFQVLLLIVAALYVGMVSYCIYKYSAMPVLSYILFIGLGFYSFGMSAIRQTIALSIVLVAFTQIGPRRLFRFISLVALASAFHISALIFLPSYLFNRFRMSIKTVLLIIALAIIVFIMRGEIRLILAWYAPNKYAAMETGGWGLYSFVVFSAFLGILYRRSLVIANSDNKYLFYMVGVAAVLLPVTQFHPAVIRLCYYYLIFLTFYIPNMLKAIPDKNIRIFGACSYGLVSTIQFFISVIPSSQLQNYMFFWQ